MDLVAEPGQMEGAMVRGVERGRMASRGRIKIEAVKETNGLTPRVQRLKQRYLAARPTVSGERAWYWMDSHKQTEGQHPALRAAKAFRNVLEKMPIAIHDDELIVGHTTVHTRGAHPRVETYTREIMARLQSGNVHTATEANVAVLLPEDQEKLFAAAAYWEKWWEQRVELKKYSDDELQWFMALLVSGMAFQVGQFVDFEKKQEALSNFGMQGGIAPGADYNKLMAKGFKGIIAEAQDHMAQIRSKPGEERTPEDEDKLANLEAVIIAMEAMITFARRYSALARDMAGKQSDAQRQKELLKIADVCENAPANPPRDFQEALQTHWFVLVGQEIEKTFANAYIGRFDQYCYPTYAKDVQEGRMTRQEAAELMGCMFMKWQSLEAFTLGDFTKAVPGSYLGNVTVGGVNSAGKDASNELSCLLLHVAAQVKTNVPHISIRYHRAMAPELFDTALECTRDHGAGIPAWFNDRGGIEHLLDRGYPLEEARDWSVLGCINVAVQHCNTFNHLGGGNVGFVNHPQLLLLALNNGLEWKTGVRIGPATGDPREFKTFDELVEAWRRQYIHFFTMWRNWMLPYEKNWVKHIAYLPFISSLQCDCIQKGQDVNHGGIRYWAEHMGPTFVDRGLTDLNDSLLAIKKVVFEDKAASMGELIDALNADWEGYEELRRKCIAAPKWGNDDDEGDALHEWLFKYTLDYGNSIKGEDGRRPLAFRQGAAWAQWAGMACPALPYGRKAWTSLADASASPTHGSDKKGPTALLNSVAKLNTAYCEGPLLNMRFTPGPLRGKEGLRKFGNMLATFFDKGGFHVQLTVLDNAMLRDAQKHPENYRNLVVRVAGYSAFWVELTPQLQEEIITRTDHCV